MSTTQAAEEIKELDGIHALKVKQSKTLQPFNVYQYPMPRDKSEAGIRQYNDQLAKKLPVWLHVYFQTENRQRDGEDTSVKRIVKFDVEAYAMQFIGKTRVESFPALMTGAIYQPETGTWRTFGKGEQRKTIESRTMKETHKWGLYSEADIMSVQRFIDRFTFNEDYGKHSPFDENPHPELVAFSNGTYNILTDSMQPSSPDNYMMNAHNYAVDPHQDDCPETEKLLLAMMGDEKTVSVFEEFVGYGFYRSHVPFQQFLWLYGSGGQAKSGLLRRIANLFGRDNMATEKPAVLADSQNRFATANLYGKEMNIVADVGTDYIKGTDKIKSLTGGDAIPAEFKGIQGFTFTNYAKQLYAANDLPAFSDHTPGFSDRVMVIKMVNGDVRGTNWWDQFDEETIDGEERPAFAMKCMHKFAAALARKSFTKSAAVDQASQEWIDANDHFKEFLDQYVQIDKNETRGESSTVVTAEFKKFCQDNNYLDKTTTQSIGKRLEPLGVTKARSRAGFGSGDNANVQRYIGLKLVGSPLHEYTG